MPQSGKFRITGGSHRGRILAGPPNINTRPMQGFLREALFSIIGDRIVDASVVDLFSGTGSIGIEALSRGANSCVFFESRIQPYKVLMSNLKALKLEKSSMALQLNLLTLKEFPSTGFEPYNIIFLDPPFPFHDNETKKDLNPLIQSLNSQGYLDKNPVLVFQIRKKQIPPASIGPFELNDRRDYGSVSLLFYI